MSEEERLAKAKQKLLDMNRKVQRAKNISEKRQTKNEEIKQSKETPTKKKESGANDYLFELTEKMINLGVFSEEEVTKYVERVEKFSKMSDTDLENNQKKIQTAIKKINKSIQFLNDPKKATETPKIEKQAKIEKPQENEEETKQNQELSYSDIAKGRQSPMVRKNMIQVPQGDTQVSKTPSKIPKPQIKKKPKADDKIQATGAGAQFLASLADDLN